MKWNVHVIEMKSSISTKEKWLEIKGKFRASYFLVQVLGAILQMEIQEVRMYTTYEKISFACMPENPVSRRAYVGKAPENLMSEWNGEAFSLWFGETCSMPFLHIPVQVFRKGKQLLEGEYCCEGERK